MPIGVSIERKKTTARATKVGPAYTTVALLVLSGKNLPTKKNFPRMTTLLASRKDAARAATIAAVTETRRKSSPSRVVVSKKKMTCRGHHAHQSGADLVTVTGARAKEGTE